MGGERGVLADRVAYQEPLPVTFALHRAPDKPTPIDNARGKSNGAWYCDANQSELWPIRVAPHAVRMRVMNPSTCCRSRVA
jgi:hypothetical protein